MALILSLLVLVGAHATEFERALSEAELCELALVEAEAAREDERRASFDRHERHVAKVLDHLRDAGELDEPGEEERARARLQFKEIFVREGVLHEAIYQTFRRHFGGRREMQKALSDFKHLTDANSRGQLVAEVIERLLQFIPDVDATSLAEFRARADFLNLSPGQLTQFYEKWRHYDQRDQFAGLLQGAVLTILTAGNRSLVDDVLRRETWGRRWIGRDSPDVPERPAAIHANILLKEIAALDRPYYATNELRDYLEASSRAARGYFVMTRARYLTTEQLEMVAARSAEWLLKSSIRTTVARELEWRALLRARFGSLAELERREGELERALRPRGGSGAYDNRRVHEKIGELWHLGATEGVALGLDLLELVEKSGTAAQFTNAVVSVRDALISRLRGQVKPVRAFVVQTVERANAVGLEPNQLLKVESVLAQLVADLPAAARRTLHFEIGRLEPRPTAYDRFSGADLRRLLADASTRRRTLEVELDRMWDGL